MNLYVIYDRVAQEGGPIFEAKNDNVAFRMVQEYLAKAPNDYMVLHVGSLSHDPVKLVGLNSPREIERGTGFVEDGVREDPRFMKEEINE